MVIDSCDRALRRAVFARLTSDPGVSTSHIGVAARSGEVILSGYVTSNAQKTAASAAAARVKGVGQVTDQVEVALPCATVRAAETPGFRAAPVTLHLLSAARTRVAGAYAAE